MLRLKIIPGAVIPALLSTDFTDYYFNFNFIYDDAA